MYELAGGGGDRMGDNEVRWVMNLRVLFGDVCLHHGVIVDERLSNGHLVDLKHVSGCKIKR